MIEQYFRNFWLPKLCATANHTAWYSYDYHLEDEASLSSPLQLDDNAQKDSFACFGLKKPLEELMSAACSRRWDIKVILSNLWHDYSFSNKKVFPRLGEGDPLFAKGPRGGYLINDTDLVDLGVGESGLRIRVNWKRTFDYFFREEMMMRDRQKTLMTEAIAELKKKNEWSGDAPLADQIRTLLLVLVAKIQQDRRFHVQMHQSLRHDASAGTMSRYLSEPVPLVDPLDMEGTADPFERQSTVTLLEAVGREEYLVFTVLGWRELDQNIMLQLCAEEYGWRCYFFYARREAKGQERRLRKEDDFMNYH
jgi:hypothetical protein